MQEIGFDIISDLYLKPDEVFTWDNKATSLYCIVAGNISSSPRAMAQVLIHLSMKYQGVFFVPGTLEYETAIDIPARTAELIGITKAIPNVCMLHQHVVIIDGVAIVGSNGWSNAKAEMTSEGLAQTASRYEDIAYLTKAIEKLQRHLDVKKIIVVTNAIPSSELHFGENVNSISDQIPLTDALSTDTEQKVHHWVFGTYTKSADTYLDSINYINNPYIRTSPYWAKRLTVKI